MDAIDVGFGGDTETTQVFRIGEASCAVPGAAAGLAARAPRLRGAAVARAAPARARARARAASSSRAPQAHLHAILDLILRHSPEGGGSTAAPTAHASRRATCCACPTSATTLERHRRGWSRVALRAATSPREIVDDGRRRRREADARRSRGATASSGAGPSASRYLGHEIMSNPPPSSGGILIAYGLALLERVRGGEPGSAEALASLVEVMREQTRARDEPFARGLHRGGLAQQLLADEPLAAASRRIAASLPGPRSTRRAAARRTSPPSTQQGTPRRSPRRPARARA